VDGALQMNSLRDGQYVVIVLKGITCPVVKMERYEMVSRHEETHGQTMKGGGGNGAKVDEIRKKRVSGN